MDILEVKKTLKKWERSFFETHERRPGREDIQQAPKRITDAYRQYQEHKKPSCQSKQPTRIIEAKSPNEKETVCPEDDFWGAHLNKSASSDDGEEKITKREKQKETALERISKKMRKNIIDSQTPKKSSGDEEGSQFKKCKPTSIPSENTPNDRETFRRKSSEDEKSGFSEAGLSPDGKESNTASSIIFKGSAFKIKSSSKSVKSDHIDIFQARRLKPLNRKQTVQTDWLKDCGDDLEDLNDKQSSVSQTEVDCPQKWLSTKEIRDERKVDNLQDKIHSVDTFVDDRQDSLRVDVGDHNGLEREVVVKLSPDKFEDEGKPIEHHCGVVKRKTKRESFEALESLASKENSEPNKLSDCDANSDLLSAAGVTQSKTNESELGISVRSSTNQRPDCQKKLGTENGGKHMLDGESGTNNFGEKVSSEEYDLCNSEPVDSTNQRACVSRTIDGDNDKCLKDISDIENNSSKSNRVGRKRKLSSSPDGAVNSQVSTKDRRVSSKAGPSLLDLNDDFEFGEEAAEEVVVDAPEIDRDEDGEVKRKAKRQRTQTSSAPAASRTSSRSSASLNQNFVRLNMKRKTYARKGAKMKGEAYKRFMWKQRNRGGGGRGGGRGGGWSGGKFQSKGNDTCFKCGQQGHWATQCNGFQKRKNVEEDENPPDEGELQPFPSVGEAAMKAAGIRPDSLAAESFNVDNIKPPVYDEPLPPPAMEPLYPPGPDGKPIDPPQDVMKALKKLGFTSFRTGQQQAVMNILSGLSTLLILSTGSGKSLCYQLPAFMYAQRSPCITLVISPLVSLMEDQIEGLPGCLRGARIHSHLTKTQRDKVMTEVSEGRVDVLLLSPEALVCSGGRILLNSSTMPPVAFACIDEAHCLSEWSHNFRPSYLMLCKVLREQFGVRCILGLTATATKSTARNVVEHFGIGGIPGSVVRGPSMPSNLVLCVSRDVDKERALVDLLGSDTYANLDSLIIYCIRREQTEKVASLIRTCLQDLQMKVPEEKGKKKKPRKRNRKADERPPTNSAEAYHAGMSSAARRKVQNAFMAGNLRVVVATVAFGMGLDKQDVRGVIHFCLPRSFESYVQEVGRSGRDGNKAVCHLLLDSKGGDLCELRKHIYSNSVDRFSIKKLVQRIFRPCKCLQIAQMNSEEETAREDGERVCQGHEHTLVVETTVNDLDIKEEGIETLLCYLELHPNRLIRVLPNTWSTCTIHCYGGPRQLRQLAQKSPVVAAAIAKERTKGKAMESESSITFEVVEVASSMGWNLSPVRRELKQLQWEMELGRGWQKTGVMVEFSDLGFHFISPGDLSDGEMDDVITFLSDRVEGQVKRELWQLRKIFMSMHGLSEEMAIDCDANETSKPNLELKSILREYFENSDRAISNDLQYPDWSNLPLQQMECSDGRIRGDIRNFIGIHQDRDFTGRAIARIFQGIPSPVYPAQVWGKDRRFWRCHLNADFIRLVRLANDELMGSR